MPKVTEKYLTLKRNEIIAAAISVCETKPAYEVTLRDVVRACGISTGGIYNYFNSIDEIYIEVLNQAHAEYAEIAEHINHFESRQPSCEILLAVFKQEGRRIDCLYRRYGKFMTALDAILHNDPKRGQQIMVQSTRYSENTGFESNLSMFMTAQINDNMFNPIIPMPQIMLLLHTAVEGIKMAIVTEKYTPSTLIKYGLSKKECATAESMMAVLAAVIVQLLNPVGKPVEPVKSPLAQKQQGRIDFPADLSEIAEQIPSIQKNSPLLEAAWLD